MTRILLIILSLFTLTFVDAQTWQQTGPPGGYFKEFAISPQNSSVVYAGSDDGGGIWKTTDGGDSWTLLTADFPNMTGWKITLSETSPDIVYACEMYGRYGILKSVDGGQTWEQITTGLNSSYDKMVSGLVMQSEDTLLISTGESSAKTPPRPGNGVFISYDAGNSWHETGLQGYTVPCIAHTALGTVFAGTRSNGLFYTNDNGVQWFCHPGIDTLSTIHEIEVKDSVVLIGSTAGVFLSTDWGMSFTNTGLENDFNFDVVIHRLSPGIEVFSSTVFGLQKYTSATSGWHVVNDELLAGQLVIGIASDGMNVYAGEFSNSPVIRSRDGGLSWAYINSPVATEINSVYADPSNSGRMLACMAGTYNVGGSFNKECIYETRDGGVNWQRKGPKAHGLCLVAEPFRSGTFYLGTFSQGLFKTSDSFDSFVHLVPGNKAITDIAVSTGDTHIVLISEFDLDTRQASIKRSVNGGSSFDVVSSLFAGKLLFYPDGNDTAFAGTNDGVYVSADQGKSWNRGWLLGETILSLASMNKTLFAGSNMGKLYKIDNSMVTEVTGEWQRPVEVKNILVSGNNLFVGLSGAEKDTTYSLNGSIWRSSDSGNTWTDITGDMTSTNIYGRNCLVGNGDALYTGTYGGGIFKSGGIITGVKNNLKKPVIKLFPNPVSGIVSIEGDLEMVSSVTVINAIGQDLTSKIQISVYSKIIKLDLSGLTTGLYIIKINGTTAGRIYKK